MTKLLIRLFIKNKDATKDQKVRTAYGKLGSVVGILANLLLCIGKLTVGIISSSMSIITDAFNNLSDSGSQIISLASFRYANKPADENHPFGYQRIEYVGSICIAFIILMLAVQLCIKGAERIFSPEEATINLVTVIVLVISILMKLWLYLFNKKLGKMIDSTTLRATGADSLIDVFATSAVLLGAFLQWIFKLPFVDGIITVVVSIFIFVSGVKILKESLNKLLGGAPSHELVKMVEDKIRSVHGVLDCHDLIIHSYGPNKTFASVHIEVDSKLDFSCGHELSDDIERLMLKEKNIHLVVHLDPVNSDDVFTNEMKKTVSVFATAKGFGLHDFRTVVGKGHSNIIFDVTVPFECKMTEEEVRNYFTVEIKNLNENYYSVVSIDYVGSNES